MATNAMISALVGGEWKTIRLHWDGYPDHALKMLQEYYKTQESIAVLMDLGDLSEIAESPECPPGHSYDNPVSGHCIAYGRDRGDQGTEAMVSSDKPGRMGQYHYLWNGEWVRVMGRRGC